MNRRQQKAMFAKRNMFVNRFEKLPNVTKAVYIPNKLHLTVFYKEKAKKEDVKRKVLGEIYDSNLERSVETMSFYPE